jgi:hypothetical protein
VAVRAAVCGSAAVCDSARGSVWQFAAVQQCATVRVAVCDSAHGSVWHCERRSVLQCGSVRQWAWQCAVVLAVLAAVYVCLCLIVFG